MSETALSIESLSLSIHGQAILTGISAEIRAGENWSIIGPNGAGKSTFLKCLMRIHGGWSGRVRLGERPLESFSQRGLARRMAYVPQAGGEERLPYTVEEFVRMGRYAFSGPFGVRHPEDAHAVESGMKRAGVARFAGRTLNTLSGGERQKVLIAAALAQETELLLLDEPTAFLDYSHQAEVFQILRSENTRSGATVISVTHDVNAAMMAGGRVLALKGGRVAWTGEATDLASENTLEKIYGARFRFLDDPVTGLRLVAPQGRDS